MAVNGGVKNWTTGQVLDAADLNEYIADQTIARFATIADRTAAYGVANAPSLQTGLFSWVESTAKLYYYDGTSWVEVGAQVEDGEIVTAKLADSAVTSAKIADGTIVNADINAAAAIAHTKLANITAGSVLMGNSSNVPTATALSGDVTVNSTGVTAIASEVIVNADVSNSAAIAYSKLNLSGSITSSDIADGTIVNADINAAAAIDKTKISGTAITAADSGTVTSTMIADGTIVNADINAAAAIDLGKLADAAIDEKSASYTLVLADKNKFIKMSVTTTANTVTVPTNASVAFPVGSQIHVIQYGTGKTQVVGAAGVNVYATPGAYLRAQYSSATLLKCDTNIWMLMGDLSAS